MKLRPKPIPKPYIKDWNDLDSILGPTFATPSKIYEPSLTIDSSEYRMSQEEIKAEAEKSGYTVEILDKTHIKFT